jgi:hypothetical protein
MRISSPTRTNKLVHHAEAAVSRMPFPKLYGSSPVPGVSLYGVALGACPRLIPADLPKTGAAEAGTSVTGSTQKRYKSTPPAKG